MKIRIDEARKVSISALTANGFDNAVAEGCVRNIIEGELVGKKTHGLIRVLHQVSRKEKGTVSIDPKPFKIIKKTSRNLYVNTTRLPGFYSIYRTLETAIPLAKKNKLFTVGIKDTDITGYIGAYARIAAENDLIFIGFNNSPGGLVPHGAKSASPWGTDPITIGIPTNSYPVIYDSASTMITWGGLMIAQKNNEKLNTNVAVDKYGKVTTNPHEVVGLLPFAGAKGSGMAMIVEMLAGVLTGSGVGEKIKGGWGSFYILIDPTMFRSIKEFKKDVNTVIKELKGLQKAKGVKEIFYPGERSAKLREKHLKQGWIEVDEKLWMEIIKLANQ